MMPASPMQMPMMLVWSLMRSRKRMRVTLSTRVLAVETIFDEVGGEALDAGVDAVEVLGGGEVVIADDEGDAGVAELLQVGLS